MIYIAFDAPSANEAYAQAPMLSEEAVTVAAMLGDLDPAQRPHFYPPVTFCETREVLLRAAAVADRTWWDTRTDEDAALAALEAAALLVHDRQHPSEVAGPYGPHSAQWRGPAGEAARAYVRQEYLAWWTSEPVEDCNNCGGTTCWRCARAAAR